MRQHAGQSKRLPVRHAAEPSKFQPACLSFFSRVNPPSPCLLNLLEFNKHPRRGGRQTGEQATKRGSPGQGLDWKADPRPRVALPGQSRNRTD